MDFFHHTKSEFEISKGKINAGSEEVQKSKLVSDGLIKFSLTGECLERYLSDPLNSKNWGITKKKN